MVNFKNYKATLYTSAKINGEYCLPGQEITIDSLQLQKDLERARSIRGRGDSKPSHKVVIGDENSEDGRQRKRAR